MENCRTLKDFKNYYSKGGVDKQDLLAEASIHLDETDLALLEIHVGE